MKNNKMKLNDLKISSFFTASEQDAKKILGGLNTRWDCLYTQDFQHCPVTEFNC